MKAYYNDNDPQACAWLRELIKEGLIADGDVDERSICDVQGSDLDGYEQCHFFAGIGGWAYALELAGWGGPVWTGSCPCQDFSHCGKQAGFEGDRDHWPHWFRIIKQRKPNRIFGEQVDDSPEWYDRAANDLEAIGYTVGACVVSAHATDNRQDRQRLFFVADSPQVNGIAHDRVVSRRNGRPSAQLRRLSGLEVAGRWWHTNAGTERLPTLLRNFDGLSALLGGFGNAIVPQVAAEFIKAYCEVRNQ